MVRSPIKEIIETQSKTLIKKPWINNNVIVIRDIMHLTILFDHDAVDGSPAARFTDALVRNIENAIEL